MTETAAEQWLRVLGKLSSGNIVVVDTDHVGEAATLRPGEMDCPGLFCFLVFLFLGGNGRLPFYLSARSEIGHFAKDRHKMLKSRLIERV